MLIIRLQRVGKRNSPAYRVVLVDSRRAPKSGGFLEILGSYNPRHKESFAVNKERISHWLSKGVQTSDTMHNLLVREGIINAPKRGVVGISKLKKEKEKGEEKVEKKTEETHEEKSVNEVKTDEVPVEEKPKEEENSAE